MIVMDPADLDLSVAMQRHQFAAPLTNWMPSLDEVLVEALASDPAFEIDWFLAAVLMSTPAGHAEPERLPLAS